MTARVKAPDPALAGLRVPDGLKLVAYGGGVNTIAVLVLMQRLGVVPRAIVMADPGSEWPETYAYRDDVMNPWLLAHGFPLVTVVERRVELRARARRKNFETLEGLCERTSSLPSIAYGWKKCSLNYKRAPQLWWTERQPWARDEWAAGRKLVKVIGYDLDEPGRVKTSFNDKIENDRYVPWYPLFDAGFTRDDCEALILDAGLPLPHKSACSYCPNNTVADWRELRATHPEHFAKAVAMSRRAASTVESPDVVGLLRAAPNGKRQLHVWVDEGLPHIVGREEEMPCECSI